MPIDAFEALGVRKGGGGVWGGRPWGGVGTPSADAYLAPVSLIGVRLILGKPEPLLVFLVYYAAYC